MPKKISLLFTFMLFSFASVIGQTYTFTTAGATGIAGPDQSMVNTAYTATTLNGQVTVVGSGIQQWVVPVTASYYITSSGASGGNTLLQSGGLGRTIEIEVALTAGDIIQIIVGQEGGNAAYIACSGTGECGGGGGGSFIYNATTGLPILVTGGGGGAGEGCPSWPYYSDGVDASAYNNTSGGDGTTTGGSWDVNGIGGTSGNGGGASQGGAGGGGFSGDGAMGNYSGIPGLSFLNGGLGGLNNDACGSGFTVNTPGGFGGGGGAGICSCYESNGGGGGGYSGGGGSNTRVGAGGGGGNFYTGLYISDGLNSGDGEVIITVACIPLSMTIDVPVLGDLTDECSVALISPTATTDCGMTVVGVPDVTFPISTQGTTLVTWSYDDGFGHTDSQTQNVVITDVSGPTPDLAVLPDVSSDCEVAALTDPGVTDNCGGPVTITNDANLPITALGTTTITWTYEDNLGNTSTQTQDIVILTVADVSVTNLGNQLSANGLVAAYQWLDCDNAYAIIPGEVNQYFSPSTPGNYAVQVTQGACMDTSACYYVDFSGIDEMSETGFNMYPNPTIDGMFTYSFTGEIKQISVYDQLGREVNVAIDFLNQKVDASELTSGKYIIRIITEDKILNEQLIIIK